MGTNTATLNQRALGPAFSIAATPLRGALRISLLALPLHPLLAGDSNIGTKTMLDMREVYGLVQGHTNKQREKEQTLEGRGGSSDN